MEAYVVYHIEGTYTPIYCLGCPTGPHKYTLYACPVAVLYCEC